MKFLLLSAIRFYQRHISPYKGFCCAYRAHTGRASCSMLGYRAVRYHGAFRGLAVLRLRLAKCGVAYRRFSGDALAVKRPAATFGRQAGFCDVPCDVPCDAPCDVGACDVSGSDLACDILSNCSPCDCGDWRREPSKKNKKRKEEEEKIYLPPEYKPRGPR